MTILLRCFVFGIVLLSIWAQSTENDSKKFAIHSQKLRSNSAAEHKSNNIVVEGRDEASVGVPRRFKNSKSQQNQNTLSLHEQLVDRELAARQIPIQQQQQEAQKQAQKQAQTQQAQPQQAQPQKISYPSQGVNQLPPNMYVPPQQIQQPQQVKQQPQQQPQQPQQMQQIPRQQQQIQQPPQQIQQQQQMQQHPQQILHQQQMQQQQQQMQQQQQQMQQQQMKMQQQQQQQRMQQIQQQQQMQQIQQQQFPHSNINQIQPNQPNQHVQPQPQSYQPNLPVPQTQTSILSKIKNTPSLPLPEHSFGSSHIITATNEQLKTAGNDPHGKHFDQMKSLTDMAKQGLLPPIPPYILANQTNNNGNNNGNSANNNTRTAPSGQEPLLPPPLLPQNHAGPSPQFLEMIKRLEKEHGGKIPPGLGAFTIPPPIPGMSGPSHSVMHNFNGTDSNFNETSGLDFIIPSMALPRDVPQQPKGPSIPQIMEIQKQHEKFMKKKNGGAANNGPTQHKLGQIPNFRGADPDFHSPLVDPTVDLWIDQQIAKKSATFRKRLGHIYKNKNKKNGNLNVNDEIPKGHVGIVNSYDPDGTVFLSKVSNILSSEHPDMSSRLDKWIDKQVDSAMSRHSHHHRDREEDSEGDVWLQNAMEKSEESDSEDGMTEMVSRDFAKGIFYGSAKSNKDFGSETNEHKTSGSGHRKFRRRISKKDTPKVSGQQVFLEIEGKSLKEKKEEKNEKKSDSRLLHQLSDQDLFATPVDHQLNWNPQDNRFRVDADTNIQDPEYTEYPLHKVIDKHRKEKGSRHSKTTLEKWTNIATGGNKDPLEGLFPGSSFDFADEAEHTGDFDMEKLFSALEGSRGSRKRAKNQRHSDAWGE